MPPLCNEEHPYLKTGRTPVRCDLPEGHHEGPEATPHSAPAGDLEVPTKVNDDGEPTRTKTVRDARHAWG